MSKRMNGSWVLVAHAYNPSYSGAEIRRITVRSQPVQIVPETLSRKKNHKNRVGGVAQGGAKWLKVSSSLRTKKTKRIRE
jgi:hypothetical protein